MSTNKPEPLKAPYQGGNAVVGEALRAFFLSLLEDKNLFAYHQDRVAYINTNVRNAEAKRLLRSAAFVNIEKHILAINRSSRAKPLFVVCPPY
jgi:hypothetical protein